MAEAFVDLSLRKRLMIDANAVLNEFGYDTGSTDFLVVENTTETYYAALPFNKWHSQNLDRETLMELFIKDLPKEWVFH